MTARRLNILDRKKVSKWRHPLAPLWPALKLIVKSGHAIAVMAMLKTPDSMRWFVNGWLATLAVVWLFFAAYLGIANPSYTSRWTLILPTSSSSSSVQVESIGHAQSTPSSPFGSTSLSPKVIYKEIISSEEVLAAAAESLNMSLGEFGGVRVKLIDETALINLEITGRTGELAQKKARTLMSEFEKQLERLRNDEIERRADVVNRSLQSYQVTLQNARARILEQQKATGVLSINQFNEAATSMELMKRRLAEAKAELQRLLHEKEALSASTGLDPAAAATMLKLSADPAFLKLATEYADTLAKWQEDAAVMGDANPILAVARDRYRSIQASLSEIIRRAGFKPEATVKAVGLVMNGTHRSDLVKSVVSADAAVIGKQQEIATLEAELANQKQVVGAMSQAVSRLEDLSKDHLLAEAIFTSALARLDTNKTDIYASYPMVQTLAAPDLPKKRASPSLLMAILFGIGASILSAAAWGMAWLRHVFIQKR